MKIKDREELIRVMARQGFSVRRLGAACGVHFTMIQQLRSGTRTSCSPALATAIAKNLGVNVEYLFDARTSSDTGRPVQQEVSVA